LIGYSRVFYIFAIPVDLIHHCRIVLDRVPSFDSFYIASISFSMLASDGRKYSLGHGDDVGRADEEEGDYTK
jgi:hypothetical protein